MTEKELFAQRAAAGYTVCYAPQCPCREHCLRWRVGQEMPDSTNFYSAVNPRALGVCTAECPHYRPSEKVRFAKGMTQTFNDDMPPVSWRRCVGESSPGTARPIITSFARASGLSRSPSRRKSAACSDRLAGTRK